MRDQNDPLKGRTRSTENTRKRNLYIAKDSKDFPGSRESIAAKTVLEMDLQSAFGGTARLGHDLHFECMIMPSSASQRKSSFRPCLVLSAGEFKRQISKGADIEVTKAWKERLE
jgi:hypothetical protein